MEDSDDGTEFDYDYSDPLENWQCFNVLPTTDGIDLISGGDVKALPSAKDMISDHSSEWKTTLEPTPDLMVNGLPAFHTCSYCQHIVIDSKLLQGGQQIPLCDTRSDMVKASQQGCPLFRWLEWTCYSGFARDTNTRYRLRFTFVLKADSSTPFAIKYFELKLLTMTNRGYEKASFGELEAVAMKGTYARPCFDTEK